MRMDEITINIPITIDLDGAKPRVNVAGKDAEGGEDLEQGYFATTNQSTGSVPSSADLFQYQLERNSFTSTYHAFTLAVRSDGAGDDVYGSLNCKR